MKSIIKYVAFAVLTVIMSANLQAENEKSYKIIMKYPLTIPFKYSCIEQTKVERNVNKDLKYDFERTAAIHFTLMMKDLPREGFANYIIKLDSINHKIQRGDTIKAFDTNEGDLIKNWNDDLEQYNMPVSYEFEYLISPYFEFADIVADKSRKTMLEDIEKNKEVMAKSDYCMWKNSLSDERFYHITDIKKIEFPTHRVAEDSTWLSPIEFQIEGVTIYDTVSVRFVEERGRYKFMEAKFKATKFLKDPVVLYDFRKQLSTPQKVDLDCIFELVLTPESTIESAAISAKGNMEFMLDDKRIISDSVDTKLNWVKLGQYNY